jgi:hypothetical protein
MGFGLDDGAEEELLGEKTLSVNWASPLKMERKGLVLFGTEILTALSNNVWAVGEMAVEGDEEDGRAWVEPGIGRATRE